MNTYNLLTFGADNQNGADCGVALQKAMEQIRCADEAATLEFPTGIYHFYKDSAPSRIIHTSNTDSCQHPVKYCGFLIENQKDLTIDGKGSQFIFHGNMQAVTVIKSQNITLRDFSWDFAVPTTVELIVTKRNTFSTEFRIPKNFQWEIKNNDFIWFESSPLDGHRYWEWKNQEKMFCIVGFHPETGSSCRFAVKNGPFSSVRSIQKRSDDSIRVSYRKLAPRLHTPGLGIELCQSFIRECAGAFIWECDTVTIEDVSVHYMNGFGFLTQMSRDVTFKRCHFVPNPTSEKHCTSFADLIHVSGAAGKVIIENCDFSHAHDDPINIHGSFTRVVKRVNETTLQLEYVHAQQGGFAQFHPGDKVAFYSRDTLESINGAEEKLYTVANCTNPCEDGNTEKTMTVQFAQPLPRGITDNIGTQKKYVAENVSYTPDVIIRGCQMESIPTRGILCTTRGKVLIENNTFVGMSMATIFLSNDSNEWYESGPIRDMTIRNNTFYILKSPQKEWADKGAIFVHPVTKGGKLPSWESPIHKNITIEDNLFYMEHDKVVKAESVENLMIRGNTIKRYTKTNPDRTITAFAFTACKHVVIQGNTCEASIDMTPVLKNMPAQQVQVTDNE